MTLSRVFCLGVQIGKDGLTGRGFTTIPHHRAQKPKIGGGQRPPIKRHIARSCTAIGIVNVGERELRVVRNRYGNADQTLVKEQAVRRAPSVGGRDISVWTVRAVIGTKN